MGRMQRGEVGTYGQGFAFTVVFVINTIEDERSVALQATAETVGVRRPWRLSACSHHSCYSLPAGMLCVGDSVTDHAVRNTCG
jgi:hypothetical protein